MFIIIDHLRNYFEMTFFKIDRLIISKLHLYIYIIYYRLIRKSTLRVFFLRVPSTADLVYFPVDVDGEG